MPGCGTQQGGEKVIQAVVKKNQGGKPKKPSEARWANRSAEDFRAQAETLRQLAQMHDSIADQMEEAGIKIVRADAAEKFKNGVEEVKGGLKKAQAAVNAAALENL